MRALLLVLLLPLPAVPQVHMPDLVCPDDKPYCLINREALKELMGHAKETPCYTRS